MPKAFDDMVSAIKAQLRKDNPKMKEDELNSRAYAIATSQWKKSHGGKAPSREIIDDWKILEFFVPIEEKIAEIVTEGIKPNDDFIIKGVAINETTTLNNVKYVAEELEKAAKTFRDVPILLDHKNEVKNIVGRTTDSVFFNPAEKRIEFEANIRDKEIQNMIKDGRIKNVSIGAKVEDLLEEDDGSMKAIGLRGLEMSFVAVPGDMQADFTQAITQNFHLKEMLQDTQLNKPEEKMVEEVKTETVDTQKIEKIVETAKIEEKTAEKKDDTAILELKREIEEMKALLVEKKKLKEQIATEESIKEDKTKGLIVVSEEAPKVESNFVIERADSGKLALYRDYSQEKSDTKLKRLVR